MKTLLVGLLAVALACGDSSGPGKSATSITGIAGDNQSTPTGATLAFPLSFTALGSDGLPIQGVSVSWSVSPTGRAIFTPQTSTTDGNGVGSTSVRAGSTPGSITIQATVTGVSPVVYHATILDPCTFRTPINVGETLSGALATSDCVFNNAYYYDFYTLDLPFGQQSLRIKMRGSGSFEDTYVDLYTEAPQLVAFDDDSILGQAGARNSQLDIITPGDTSYLIGANSFDEFATGAYTLVVEARPAEMNGCREVWVVRGVTVSDSLKASDCADSAATPHYYDVARIVVFAPSVLTISQRSTAINPSLKLYLFNANAPLALSRTLVASNDDSLATNTNAFIQYSVTQSNFYDVIITSSAGGETGDYTFEVSASTTLSPRISRLPPAARGGRDSWWRDVLLPKRAKL